MRIIYFLIACFSFIACAPLFASDTATGPHIRASLVSETKTLVPGKNWVGIWLQPEAKWHTYWRNPGDSGEAPSITWRLPDGVSAGEIRWPVPQAIPVAHLVNYGYEADTLLMVPIEIDSAFDAGKSFVLEAEVSWLVCKEDCIPGSATLSRSIQMSAQTEPSTHAALFDDTRRHWPQRADFSARHEATDSHFFLELPAEFADPGWRVFPYSETLIQHAADQVVTRSGDNAVFTIAKSEYSNGLPSSMTLLLSDGDHGLTVTSELSEGAAVPNTETTSSLWLYALMAFVGGLILNLMPCVLPILSLKALSLNSATGSAHHPLAYAAGVLFCFNLFFLLVLALRSGGDAVGWGFHLQQPWMIVALAFLFTFIALMLLDVLPQSGRWSSIGDSLTHGDHFAAQFFTGVLAVVVASPCTAPFMAAALGVAMVSDWPVALVVFNALAIGFALPLTLVYLLPRLRRRLPRPGAWMQHFKHFLAFPMFATVAWLVWIFAAQTSLTGQLILMFCLLGFAFVLWLMGPFKKLQPLWRALALALVFVPMLVVKTVERELNGQAGEQTYSQQLLDQLRQQNQVVFVNMTADWCITCKVNEQVALSSERFKALLQDEDVHYLVGDWTNKNDAILSYLNRYQRSGVPLYVVYSGRSGVQVLPQLLTTDTVIQAINQAKENVASE